MATFVPQDVVTANMFDGIFELYIDNVLLGATDGGCTLALATELGEKTADQSPLLEGSYLKKQRCTVKFKLADQSLTNMKKIYATNSSTAGAGNMSLYPVHQLKIVGRSPSDGTRTFTAEKARFMGNTSGPMNIGQQLMWEVEMLIESNHSNADGIRYFSIADA